MKTYDPAPKEVHEHCARRIEAHYPDLKTGKARIDLLMVWADEGQNALTLHGYTCGAVVRVIGPKDRVAGRGDAEIVINREYWESLKELEKDALLDHELHHLIVKKDRYGAIQFDEHGRPLMKMKFHDHQFGWFDDIAKRHGIYSGEVQQARAFMHDKGQIYLDLTATGAPDLRR